MPASYPDAIKTLLSGEHRSSKHILQHIRKYNRAFQMTYFGCHEDKIPGWQPTFRIKGQIHHRIGSLFTENDERLVYCQIFLIEDAEQQVEQRTIYFDNLDLKEYFIRYTVRITSTEILTENNAVRCSTLSLPVMVNGTHEQRFNLPRE